MFRMTGDCQMLVFAKEAKAWVSIRVAFRVGSTIVIFISIEVVGPSAASAGALFLAFVGVWFPFKIQPTTRAPFAAWQVVVVRPFFGLFRGSFARRTAAFRFFQDLEAWGSREAQSPRSSCILRYGLNGPGIVPVNQATMRVYRAFLSLLAIFRASTVLTKYDTESEKIQLFGVAGGPKRPEGRTCVNVRDSL